MSFPQTAALIMLQILPLSILFCGVLFLCGDENAPGIWGRTSRFFMVTVPTRLKQGVVVVPGGSKMITSCSAAWTYLFYKPNPMLQFFYLALMLGSFLMYHVVGGVALIEAAFPNTSFHIWFPYVFFNWVLYTFFRASSVSPGYVSEQNVQHLEKLYPYDGFLYVKRTCETCNLPRVARSKHDRFSNRCVEKFDHWCPWINNAVGARNYRWFLMFVFSTMAFLGYAAVMLGYALLHITYAERLWDAEFIHTVTRERVKASPMVVLQFLLSSRSPIIFLFTLSLIMSLCLLLFLAYHFYLAMTGVTTNESAKWSSVRSFYKSEAFKELVLNSAHKSTEDEASLITPEFGKSIEERETLEFPREQPCNAYDYGPFENLRLVARPFWFYGRSEAVKAHDAKWAEKFGKPPGPGNNGKKKATSAAPHKEKKAQ